MKFSPQASKFGSRTQTVVFCGLSIALLTVSAWISIPLGPVPVTLQVFVLVFILLALSPRQCILAILGYLLLGALGLPVFSLMRGGIGVLAGPTGGFLWGFLLAAICSLAFLRFIGVGSARKVDNPGTGLPLKAVDLSPLSSSVAALIFLLVMYLCGWLQLVFVTGMSPEAAFLAGVAPFVVIDAIKAIVAVFVAQAVRSALGKQRA